MNKTKRTMDEQPGGLRSWLFYLFTWPANPKTGGLMMKKVSVSVTRTVDRTRNGGLRLGAHLGNVKIGAPPQNNDMSSKSVRNWR